MKLCGEHIPSLDDGDERNAVIAIRYACLACIESSVRVSKIKISVLRNPFEQFARAGLPVLQAGAPQLVPSHVRQTIDRRQSRHFLWEEGQPFVARRFVARREHGLQTETNS